MGVAGVMGLFLLLLPVVQLTMPGAQENCGQNEYPHEGLCCVLCEAGTFVADHCSVSHWRGKCDPCKEGKGFTAHANGLEGCVPCRQCNEDQIMLSPCTLTQDAECQCKQGYSCADEGCEICERISQMHPDGKELSRNSTDATDAGTPNQGMSVLVWVFLALSVSVLVIVVVVIKELKCDKAASTDKDAERGLKNVVDKSVVSEQGTVLCRSWKCRRTVCLRRIAKSSLAAKPAQNSAFQQNALSNVPSGTPANCQMTVGTRSKSDNC